MTKTRKEKQLDKLGSVMKNSSIQEMFIDDPKRGGKTSNTAREEVDIGSEVTPLKDGSDELFKMPNILEALLDEEILEDDPETLDGELHEQESRESNCIVSNTKINSDHLEDSEKSSSENVKIDKSKS